MLRPQYTSHEKSLSQNSLSVKEAFGDKVTAIETEAPLGHVEATLMWMMQIFAEGL